MGYIEGEHWDVVVYGGTPGGIMAAIAAARSGCRTLLVERNSYIGGMSTNGLGKSDIENRAAIGGLFREFVERVYNDYVQRYGKASEQVRQCRDGYYYEPSVAERVFERMLANEPNLEIRRRQQLASAETRSDQLIAMLVTGGPGSSVTRFTAEVFIDATYEGDLAAAAGAEYRLGREARDEFNEPHAGVIYRDYESGKILPGSTGQGDSRLPAYTYRLCLTTDPGNAVPLLRPPAGYDRSRYVGYLQDLAADRFVAPKKYRDGWGYNPAHYETLVRVFSVTELPNHKNDVNINPRPLGFPFPEENAGYVEGSWEMREQICRRHRDLTLGLLYFLQNDESVPAAHRTIARQYHLPRDEFVDNGHFPRQLYIREARRIQGEYTLTEHDVTVAPNRHRTPIHFDSIATGEFPIDSFPVRRYEPGRNTVLEGYLSMLEENTRPYQIPYAIMVPVRVERLLVPVAASATHVAFSTIRMEPCWMAMGQAAGTAAALAIERREMVRDISIDVLQRRLLEQGQIITYFYDLDEAGDDRQAIQFFGARGYFHDYHAQPRKLIARRTAAAWFNMVLQPITDPHQTIDNSSVPEDLVPMQPDAPVTVDCLREWCRSACDRLRRQSNDRLQRCGEVLVQFIDDGGTLPTHVGNGSGISRGQFCSLLYRLVGMLPADLLAATMRPPAQLRGPHRKPARSHAALGDLLDAS